MVAVKAAPPGAATSTSFRAKIDDGFFNWYTFSNNTWTVYDKKGTRYLYGSDDLGRQYDIAAGNSSSTYKWMLQEVRDTNGNYIKYTYKRDSNELYPSTIVYTGNGSTDGSAVISFATSTRADIGISYAPDFNVTTNYRISGIDAAFNGSTVRKYLLGYGTGNNGVRSLLTSVQEQGYDDNNNLMTLPATTFGYLSSTAQFYQPGLEQIQAPQNVVADTDGDGINDINVFNAGAGGGFDFVDNAPTAIAVPNSTTPTPDYWAILPQPYTPQERGVRYIDANGDGLPDVVRGWIDDIHSTSDYAIYQNQYATTTGTYGWSATTTSYSGTVPTFAKETTGGLFLTGGLFGDVNGDGLPDYVTSLPGTFSTTTYLGNGSAWDATTTGFIAAKSFPTTVQTDTASQLVDINGDGLDDWVYSSGNNTYVLLNNGKAWATTTDARWTIATSTLQASTSTPNTFLDRGIRFMDLNGDGLPDLVRSYQNTGGCGAEVGAYKAVWLNTGSGWATSTAYTLPAYIVTCPGSSMQTNEYANFYGNGQQAQDLLTKISDSKGGNTNIAYTETGNAGSIIRVPAVTAKVTDDGRGNYSTTTYAYSGGAWYTASGVRDRRFAGFSQITVTNPDSIVTTYYNQGSLASLSRPIRTDITNLSSTLKRRTYDRWDTTTHGTSTAVFLGREIVEDFADDGTHRDKAV
jgi:hypothetical protein